MEEKRTVVLTRSAEQHITDIYKELRAESESLATEVMDNFLDVVFSDIPQFPLLYPVCDGTKSRSTSYRIASIGVGFRVIFQVFKRQVLILMILHESELPF